MFKKLAIVLFVFILFPSVRNGFCFDENATCGLKEIGVFTGWAGSDSLKDDQGHYQMVLTGGRFGWNIKPWAKFIKFPEASLFEFVVEPYVNTVTNPDSNVELGTSFFFKYAHPIFKNKLLGYIEIGTGGQWMSQHLHEQSTQFNFASAGGAGLYYLLRDNLAINAGFRYRHMSNCGIDHPNSGVNTYNYLAGISWLY